jgi:murein DD-endopeptidase MepM/ murein hydrolase activator NlpD
MPMKVLKKVPFTMLRLLSSWAVSTGSFVTFAASSPPDHHGIELYGSMTQGSLIRGKVTPDSTITLNQQKILVTDEGFFAFGFGRNASKKHTLLIHYPDGVQKKKSLKISERTYITQKIEGISKKITHPSTKDVERAKKDSKMIGTARKKVTPITAFMDEFQWPAVGPISGVYGSQRFYNGVPSRPHYGVDVANPTGSPVVAPASGLITLAVADMFYSGGTIILDHGYGVTSTFLHLSKLNVKVGQEVKTGEKIGEIGATGRATGAHLDWRINWFNEKLDPQLIVDPMPSK